MELVRGALTGKQNLDEDSSFFLKNGSNLLEELITQLNEESKIHIRNFSAKEIVKATNNFDSHNIVCAEVFNRTYKGSFQKRQILVKEYHMSDFSDFNWQWVDSAVRDIAISSEISFHKNALTLIGYCLDFKHPALVYQSPEAYDDGCLFYSKKLNLTWENRMSIAYVIANVLAYLHTGFRSPLIYRSIILRNIFIDKHCTAKLADYSLCIPIPLGECQVEDDMKGMFGHTDPISLDTGVLMEKADVYNVGAVLVELFTGKDPWDIFKKSNGCYSTDDWRSYIERDDVENIVSDDIVIEEGTVQIEQLRAFAVLALKCLEAKRENRPEMLEVAKELRRIQQLTCSSSAS